MLKQAAILILGSVSLLGQAAAQTFKQQFSDLVSKRDTIGQQRLLEEWEKENGEDPELFVAYFNHYVIRSKREVLVLGQDPKGDDVIQIMEQDTAKKEPVAFMYGDIYYDTGLLNKGFEWIDKGIEKYPNRLDMRFGKVHMFGKIEDYEQFTAEIIRTIDRSSVNKNGWTWADNKPLDDPDDLMLGSIQSYQVQLYNTGNDDLLDNMKRIAEAVLKHYPDHVESLSNLSIALMLQEQYDKALEPLLRAEKLTPQDHIVLSNIAQAHKLKGDNKNAIRYYELVILHGDEQAREYAQQQIEELKDK